MKVLCVKSKEIVDQIESMSKKSLRLKFALDGNGEYIISKNVLNDPKFSEAHELLLKNSIEIEFVPVPTEET